MHFFCLPFWSLLSISSPEQGGGEQESRRSCCVWHTLAEVRGFTYLTKTCFFFFFRAFDSHCFSVREEEALLCQWNSSPSLPLRFGLLIAVISSVSLLISSAFRWWDLNCQCGELAKELPSPPPSQTKRLFPSPPALWLITFSVGLAGRVKHRWGESLILSDLVLSLWVVTRWPLVGCS